MGDVEDYCEKYPSLYECKQVPLPIYFAIPRIDDFRGGSILLGLDKIVVPGLLLSFAARLDEAQRLLHSITTMQQSGGGSNPHHYHSNGGIMGGYYYFVGLVFAYGVGLLLSYLSVAYFGRLRRR